ncbi:MAG: endonuclease domain-containing protein [Flavobacteriaceae bacterium]|nr:endonuclease domain-containing protein [Flavobacteriaceae bacterium]
MKKDWLKINGMHDGASSKIFDFASRLRANMTLSEKKLREYLKTKPHGFKFRRQHPIGKYILDFYCHRKRLSIEIDGKNHNLLDQIINDVERTGYLNRLGIKEIRFKNEEVLNDLDRLKLNIKNELI